MLTLDPQIIAAVIGAIAAISAALITRGYLDRLIKGLSEFIPELWQQLLRFISRLFVGVVSGIIVYSIVTYTAIVTIEEDIPLGAGWMVQVGNRDLVLTRYNPISTKEGLLTRDLNLNQADEYAEFFLDLRSVKLRNFNQKEDGTYNLSGIEVVADVQSDSDFQGIPDHRNGVQVILEDKNWHNAEGPFILVGPALMQGMRVSNNAQSNDTTKNVAAVSIKFTINSASDNSVHYFGKFYLNNVKLHKKTFRFKR